MQIIYSSSFDPSHGMYIVRNLRISNTATEPPGFDTSHGETIKEDRKSIGAPVVRLTKTGGEVKARCGGACSWIGTVSTS